MSNIDLAPQKFAKDRQGNYSLVETNHYTMYGGIGIPDIFFYHNTKEYKLINGTTLTDQQVISYGLKPGFDPKTDAPQQLKLNPVVQKQLDRASEKALENQALSAAGVHVR